MAETIQDGLGNPKPHQMVNSLASVTSPDFLLDSRTKFRNLETRAQSVGDSATSISG